MQAHTLGEVGILGTILLGVSFGTILPIFIEIGSYLAEESKKYQHFTFLQTARGLPILPVFVVKNNAVQCSAYCDGYNLTRRSNCDKGVDTRGAPSMFGIY